MFAAIYGTTNYKVQSIINEIRDPYKRARAPQVSTSTATPPAAVAAAAANECRQPIDMVKEQMNTDSLCREEVTAAREELTEDHAYAHEWFSLTAELVGDNMPNSQEIHLDPMSKVELWLEYIADMRFLLKRNTFLGYDKFLAMWKSQFGHVKIRKFKSVTGKCAECALVSPI